MNFGWTELLIIFFIIILMFGAKKLPELARGLGASVKNFKEGINGEDENENKKSE